MLLNRLAALLLPPYTAYLEYYCFGTFGVIGGHFFVAVGWIRSYMWKEYVFQTASAMVGGLAIALSLIIKSILPGIILSILGGAGIMSLNLSTRLWRG
jgi:hypothetical protein